jgi:hypothetical protein
MYTQRSIFVATAKCTVKSDGRYTWFDADEFFQIALADTELEGSA